jgi:hypothetical protein
MKLPTTFRFHILQILATNEIATYLNHLKVFLVVVLVFLVVDLFYLVVALAL